MGDTLGRSPQGPVPGSVWACGRQLTRRSSRRPPPQHHAGSAFEQPGVNGGARGQRTAAAAELRVVSWAQVRGAGSRRGRPNDYDTSTRVHENRRRRQAPRDRDEAAATRTRLSAPCRRRARASVEGSGSDGRLRKLLVCTSATAILRTSGRAALPSSSATSPRAKQLKRTLLAPCCVWSTRRATPLSRSATEPPHCRRCPQ